MSAPTSQCVSAHELWKRTMGPERQGLTGVRAMELGTELERADGRGE
jgi:hypothetical protein